MTVSHTLSPEKAARGAAARAMSGSVAAEAEVSAAARLIERQRASIFPCVKPLYAEPLVLVEAEGVRARGADGREYLDLFAGILTTSIGHCHPRVVAAVRDQVGRLGHTSNLYVTEPYVAAAERLVDLAPEGLSQVIVHQQRHRGRRDRPHAGADVYAAQARSSACASATPAAARWHRV